jgi:hypothetical protein
VPPSYGAELVRASPVLLAVAGLLAAVISPKGCVDSLQSLRNPDDRLTLAAMVAVSVEVQPDETRRPVPIVMTVTVNFALE